eukprot:TRINITY_DN6362_c0_g1_i8.p3 TRINITY_DN6362_c0_g1~~TRINITY_DN6362_c0_g1_i8.p3  ORF type:complete len:142 (-),score=6.95 TRINITY_DN6362_c0_g1_i8:287-712(-)
MFEGQPKFFPLDNLKKLIEACKGKQGEVSNEQQNFSQNLGGVGKKQVIYPPLKFTGFFYRSPSFRANPPKYHKKIKHHTVKIKPLYTIYLNFFFGYFLTKIFRLLVWNDLEHVVSQRIEHKVVIVLWFCDRVHSLGFGCKR